MKKYIKAEVEIIELTAMDVLTESLGAKDHAIIGDFPD